MAVLGFGDRSFPAYCAFAKAVAAAAEAKGWPELLPFDTIDRQSPQDFARWGRALGQALGIELELSHQPVLPATETLTLVSRRDYGVEVQAPTAILRFALPRATLWQRLTGAGFARFAAGDLLGILPEGSAVPRFYSLASGAPRRLRRDRGEEAPRRPLFGAAHGARTGRHGHPPSSAATPVSRPGQGRAPLILIGAGTGIGPLAGFVRANARRRPVHLFFGMRHPDSDFLYGEELLRLAGRGPPDHGSSRPSRAGARPHYVQDALRAEAAEVARLIRDGARVMVCGGRDMAAGVADALADILAPVGLTPVELKAEGRYVEDVY